jgi:hypothetical protein
MLIVVLLAEVVLHAAYRFLDDRCLSDHYLFDHCLFDRGLCGIRFDQCLGWLHWMRLRKDFFSQLKRWFWLLEQQQCLSLASQSVSVDSSAALVPQSCLPVIELEIGSFLTFLLHHQHASLLMLVGMDYQSH